MKNYFHLAFKANKTTIFEVSYYLLGNDKNPYFSTSASVFNRPKSDFNQSGQCQPSVLKGDLLKFYQKWDKKHLLDLNDLEYNSLIEDLDGLKQNYNYIQQDKDISFNELKELSKLTPKTK